MKHLSPFASVLITCLALTSCGSDDPSPATFDLDEPSLAPAPPAAAMNTVEGWVAAGPPAAIIDSVPDAGLAGAEVIASAADGTVIGVTSTDEAGHFGFENLATGATEITVCATPPCQAPDASDWVTVHANANIVAGQDPPVTRQDAIDMVVASVSPDACVLATLQPLAAGTLVHAADEDPTDPAVSRTLPADEWFFMINLGPTDEWGHRADYVFVDAATGAATTLNVEGRPWVGGGPMWLADLDYIVPVEGVFDDPTDPPLPPTITGTPTLEVAQIPASVDLDAPPSPVATLPAVVLLPSHNIDAESVFVMNAQGGKDSYFKTDRLNMQGAFRTQGVPADNIRMWSSRWYTNHAEGWADYKESMQELESAIAARYALGLHSTLVIYWSAHHTKGRSRANGWWNVEYLPNVIQRVFPDDLCFYETQACKVRVILETCYADLFPQRMYNELALGQNGDPPDFTVYASSQRDQTSKANGLINWLSNGLSTSGAWFTARVARELRIVEGDIGNLADMNGDPREEVNPYFQEPVFSFWPNVPARCDPGGGVQPPPPPPPPTTGMYSISTDAILFTHYVGSSPCPQITGTFSVTNTGMIPIVVNNSSNQSALLVQDTRIIQAGETYDFEVLFDCSSTGWTTGLIQVSIDEHDPQNPGGGAHLGDETVTVTATFM